jgi:hypothetical protein
MAGIAVVNGYAIIAVNPAIISTISGITGAFRLFLGPGYRSYPGHTRPLSGYGRYQVRL